MEIGDATNNYGSTVCTLKSNQSIKDVIFQYSTTYPQDEEQLLKYNHSKSLILTSIFDQD